MHEPDEPSPLLLAIAHAVRGQARAAGRATPEYAGSLTAVELAGIVVGWAALQLSPHNPGRDDEVAALRDDVSLRREVVPAIVASPAAAAWNEPLATESQTWINLRGREPPSPTCIAAELTKFPALATKPLGGIWTSRALPGLATIWLTPDPEDWGELPGGASVWNVRPAAERAVRCYEIAHRQDWVSLCEAFPEDSTDFPSYRQGLRNSSLHWSPPFITPDWNAVREAYEAVHLQWRGFVDANYELVPVLNGTTCLAGWGSEATLWLRWTFDHWYELPAQ